MAAFSRLAIALLLSVTLPFSTRVQMTASAISVPFGVPTVPPPGPLSYNPPENPPDLNGQGWSAGIDQASSGYTLQCGPNRALWDMAIQQLQAAAKINNVCDAGDIAKSGNLPYSCGVHINITAEQPKDPSLAPTPESSAIIAVCVDKDSATIRHGPSPPCDAPSGSTSVVGAAAYLRDNLGDQLGEGGRAWIAYFVDHWVVMSSSRPGCNTP